MELARLSAPGAEVVLRDELVKGIAAFLDTQFIDPAVAAVATVSPASITNATTPIVSAGSSQANAATDIQALLTQFVVANPDIESLVLLMKPANAVAIARATNTPTLGLNGGTIYGIPVVTSGNVRSIDCRFAHLESRLAALEASHAALDLKALKGGAPWQRGTGYAANDIVQHDGKCIEAHVSGATFSHEHFLLEIKRGRDARDAR